MSLNRDEDFINKARKYNKLSILCGMSKSHLIIRLGNVSNGKSQAGMVYSIDGISQTLCACTHGYAIGYIKVK